MKRPLCRLTMMLLLTVMALLLTACTDSKPAVGLTELADWQQYTIVRPDDADESTKQAAILLMKSIEEKLGTRLTLTTDWVKRGEEPPAGTLEILVGATNRPESAHDLQYNDYLVEFIGNRLVITGGCGDAVLEAATWYIEACIDETLMTPAAQYLCEADYPCEDVTINGIALRDFKIDENDPNTEVSGELIRWLAVSTGQIPEKGESGIIRFARNPSLNVDEMSISVRDGDLWLEASEYGYGQADMLNLLIRCVEQRESDTMTLNERITIPMEKFSSFITCTDSQLSEWQKRIDARRTEIRTSPNMEIPDDAVVFYISESGNDENDGRTPETAWKSIARMSRETLPAGSYVCFERGGIYRGKFTASEGVTYTAYGEGNKPEIWGSPLDAAREGEWTEVHTNVWRYSQTFTDDVGGIVMNGGEVHGTKIILDYSGDSPIEYVSKQPFSGFQSLDEEYEFWHDMNGTKVVWDKGGSLYLCCKGNPSEVFDSIELLTRGHIIVVGTCADVTIDNLCIKYGGGHGIGAGTCRNLTVTNCEVGWIGGSLQNYTKGVPVRYGNGIQVYGGCDGYLIDNCYVYECYDAGVTHQYQRGGTIDVVEKNVTYTNNLIERCVYSIEYFMGVGDTGKETRVQSNIVIRGNLLVDAGYGWGKQRPDKTSVAHIKGWDHYNVLEGGFIIENNLFLRSTHMMLHVGASSEAYLPTSISGNIFAQSGGSQWARYSKNPTSLLPFDYDSIDSEIFADNEFYILPTE